MIVFIIGSFHYHIHVHSLIAKGQTVDIKVDVKAEKTLVLHPAILCDHEDILFSDQVVDTVSNFLGCLSGFFNGGSRVVIKYYLLDDLVDDLGLLGRFLAITLHLFESANDKHRHSLVLFEGNLDLFVSCLVWLLIVVLLLRLFLGLHLLYKRNKCEICKKK